MRGRGYVLRTFVFLVLSIVLAHKYPVCGIEVLVLMIMLYREDVMIEKGVRSLVDVYMFGLCHIFPYPFRRVTRGRVPYY